MNKFIGAFLGFLFAGPIGGFFGILIGHIFDKNFSSQYRATAGYQNIGTQQLFFETTFLVMGYIAKLGGAVSQASIDNARNAMHAMSLDEASRLRAMYLFNQGKTPDFEIEVALKHLLVASYQDKSLLKQFLVIQTQAAVEKGVISSAKRKALIRIYQILGFSTISFSWFEDFAAQTYSSRKRYDRASEKQGSFDNSYHNDFDPYQTLGISERSTVVEIKQAYRRLLNKLHPDKLASKGLSTQEIKRAEQKIIRIQKAYTIIKKLRQFS